MFRWSLGDGEGGGSVEIRNRARPQAALGRCRVSPNELNRAFLAIFYFSTKISVIWSPEHQSCVRCQWRNPCDTSTAKTTLFS